jgi:hypothetical protein
MLYRQAQRFGLAFRAASAAISFYLLPDAVDYFKRAASKRSLTRDAMIRILLLEVAADPNLLDNILDDRADEMPDLPSGDFEAFLATQLRAQFW